MMTLYMDYPKILLAKFRMKIFFPKDYYAIYAVIRNGV